MAVKAMGRLTCVGCEKKNEGDTFTWSMLITYVVRYLVACPTNPGLCPSVVRIFLYQYLVKSGNTEGLYRLKSNFVSLKIAQSYFI